MTLLCASLPFVQVAANGHFPPSLPDVASAKREMMRPQRMLHLRVKTIRENLEGLEHVEALLKMRGVDLARHHVPRKTAQRRDTALIALGALRSGPKTGKEVSQRVTRSTDQPMCSESQWVA